MIICPNCNHQELDGAIYCSECGTLLNEEHSVSTHEIPRTTTGGLVGAYDQEYPRVTPSTFLEADVSLCVVETGQIIPLQEREDFTLGRSAEGQPILPDIDLAPYRAYEYGVSRLHASIKLSKKQVAVTDLGSVNGTRINGQKIPPHKSCNLNHGDILTLGKLKLQLLIRP